MTRKIIDCRSVPNDIGCTLAITGNDEEVLDAAVAHAVTVHGHTDDEELRAAITAGMHDDPAAATAPGGFVQLIEFGTHRIEDFDAAVAGWAQAIGAERTARWAITGADRDQPDTYLQMVEFPDHAAAMANSAHPATAEFADQLAKLCESGPRFRNLDIHHVDTF